MEPQAVCGTTRLLALLGDPVAHSLSPSIHNRICAHVNVDCVYVALRVSASNLHAVIAGLRASNFAGANVTIPHKQAIVPYCDTISALSQVIGAVNTLYWENGLLCGTTTDAIGFYRALSWQGFDVRGSRIVILGNGGTARTLCASLAIDRLPSQLTLAGRDAVKVARLAAEISRVSKFAVGSAGTASGEFRSIMKDATLLVNCTSAGMHPNNHECPIDETILTGGLTVFDTIYNPSTTRLLAAAKSKGCAAQNGLRMLLYQALASFKLWTGIDVDENIFDMRELEQMIDSSKKQ